MHDGLCPECGRVGRWSFHNYSLSLPPTGGDYEWVETDAQTTCPHCKTSIKVRIRVDLDDQSSKSLIYSPFPTRTRADWHCYVVARVRMWSKEDVGVMVLAFAEDVAGAEQALQASGGGYHSGYERREVLRLSAAGYQALDGTWLPESAKSGLRYDLW